MTKPNRNKEISPEILRELLAYNPDDGTFIWKERNQKWFKSEPSCKSWNTKYSGEKAFTSINSNGYKQGMIMGKVYSAHRVAFAIYHGRWPSDQIDHINGHKTDNRIANLNNVAARGNNKNKKRSINNTSGVTGVSWDKSSGRWLARIGVNSGVICVGSFDSKEDAIFARKMAEMEYGFHPNHDRQI